MTTISTFETLVFNVIECYSCGVKFGLPRELDANRLRDHKSFWCPNGHQQSYTGETPEQKLTKQLKIAQRDKVWAENRASRMREERDAETRRLSAAKGQATKLRKRLANGVCPCCKRQFADLHRHMTGQHPEWAEADS